MTRTWQKLILLACFIGIIGGAIYYYNMKPPIVFVNSTETYNSWVNWKDTYCTEYPEEEMCNDYYAKEKLRDFQTQLNSAFLSEPLCHGIIFTIWDGKALEPFSLPAYPDFRFSLKYEYGESSQQWEMLDVRRNIKTSGDTGDTGGIGKPDDIARKVCAIVTKRGGAMIN